MHSPPPTDTPNEQLHMVQFSLKEIKKLAEQLLYMGNEKIIHNEMSTKGSDTILLTFTSNTSKETCSWEGTLSSQLFHRNERFGPHNSVTISKTPTKGTGLPISEV